MRCSARMKTSVYRAGDALLDEGLDDGVKFPNVYEREHSKSSLLPSKLNAFYNVFENDLNQFEVSGRCVTRSWWLIHDEYNL